ncbi:MAG: hypothetical protein AB1650_07735 [Candidatus Omnitrophota bacterium]
MVQNVQDLINKIKHEGLEAGRESAGRIEAEARKRSEAMIAKAHLEAGEIIAEARAKQKRLEESVRASLHQAARDTVLSLKKRIEEILRDIMKRDIHESLGKEQIAGLIVALAKQYMEQHGGIQNIRIGLNESDRKALEQHIVAKLKEAINTGITVRTRDDLTGGFMISFDEGKSSFDFSEDALVEYLKKYVNEYVAGLLKT